MAQSDNSSITRQRSRSPRKSWSVGTECAPLLEPIIVRDRRAQGIGVSSRFEVDPAKRLDCADCKDWPEMLQQPRIDFPLVARYSSEMASVGPREGGLAARSLLHGKLRKHGAVLLKGLPITTAADFSEFVAGLGWTPVRKHGVSERVEYAQDVFGASDDVPDDFMLGPHNEQAYYTPDSVPTYPRKICFCSLVPAKRGGETPVCRNRDMLSTLRPGVVEKMRAGVIYEQRMPSGRLDDAMVQNLGGAQCWQKAFGVTTKAEAELAVQKQGCTHQWEAGDELVIRRQGPVFVPSSQPDVDQAEELWLNQAHNFYSFKPLYMDGQPLEEDVLSHITAELWRHSVGFTWEQGDVLCIDNEVCTHARTSFEGPRKNCAAFFQ